MRIRYSGSYYNKIGYVNWDRRFFQVVLMIERFFIAIISFNYPTKNQASLSPEIFLYYLEFQTLIKFPNKLQKK